MLERLRNETGETAHVAVLSGADVVYVDRLESPQMLRVLTRVGRRRPAHATSSGKCLLAFGRPADVAAVLAAGFPRLGPRTITSKSMLEKALATVRRTGYAVSIEEAAPDVASVAAPIFDGAGECVAAVSVAGPITRIPQERLDKLAHRPRGRGERLVDERPVSVSGGGARTRPCRWRRRASSPPLGAPRGACASCSPTTRVVGPTIEIAAMTGPSTSARTGTASDDNPSSVSSTLCAYPCSRTRFSSAISSLGTTIV